VSVLVRRAKLPDTAAACNLVRRSINELCGADHHNDEPTISDWLRNKTEENFAAWISSERHIAIVAERAGAIVGFGLLNRSGTIALLYVLPEARFGGVSKTLLGELERHAVASGINKLTLESSQTALSFYESCGYLRSGDTVPGFGVSCAYPLHKHIAP
jgi:GNAT superfamily N-acetyltransferase